MVAAQCQYSELKRFSVNSYILGLEPRKTNFIRFGSEVFSSLRPMILYLKRSINGQRSKHILFPTVQFLCFLFNVMIWANCVISTSFVNNCTKVTQSIVIVVGVGPKKICRNPHTKFLSTIRR